MEVSESFLGYDGFDFMCRGRFILVKDVGARAGSMLGVSKG